MDILEPRKILADLAGHLEESLRENLVVVGSLAAAHHAGRRLRRRGVATKDADLLVHPAGDEKFAGVLMDKLLGKGWVRSTMKFKECHPLPISTPPEKCRAIRLHPPGSTGFYLEVLGVPELDQTELVVWKPVDANDGRYALPAFRFMGVAIEGATLAAHGFRCALPSSMALANLLSHPALGTQRMTDDFGNKVELRSAKDLGRALAMWRLEPDDRARAGWMAAWIEGIQRRFPATWRDLAPTAGKGLRELMGNPPALREAYALAGRGLLNGYDFNTDQMKVWTDELLEGPVRELEEQAGRGPAHL